MADRTHEVEDEVTGAPPEGAEESGKPRDDGQSAPRDPFISSEVADRTSRPMQDGKTRS